MNKEAIIIFQKNSQKGKVKTRLAVGIGEKQALEVYQKLCFACYKTCNSYSADKFLFFDSYIPSEKIQGTEEYHYQVQEGGDLGRRMEKALQKILNLGYQKVVLIGTDCPELNQDHLDKAFENLEHYQVVLGPAIDGGYYMIGVKNTVPSIFEEIPWSTDLVLNLTREKLQKLNLSHAELETLSDIDTKDDLDAYISKFGEL